MNELINEELVKKKKVGKWVYWVGGIAAAFLLGIVSWMALETGVEITSHADFCGVCHVMEPMVDSYLASTHGGNNPRGIMTPCTDCHVSHENIYTHFVGKAKSGTHDVWVVMTTDETKNDWQALRSFREEYVYDSGCLTCHRNLEKATQDTREHEKYFAGISNSECVNCHEEVGHDNLNQYLYSNKYSTDN
jgi:cytochrome c-type protein NapC